MRAGLMGLTRRPLVMVGFAFAFAFLLVASALPTPTNWGRPEAEHVQDLHVATRVTWDPGLLGGKWVVEEPRVSVHDAPWVSVRAWWANLLSVANPAAWTSPSRSVVTTLEDTNGHVVQQERSATGEGGLFGTTKIVSSIFREVPPGTYTVRARVVDDLGDTLAQAHSSVTLSGGA